MNFPSGLFNIALIFPITGWQARLSLSACFFSSLSFSQSSFTPIERNAILGYERLTSSRNTAFHSSVKPFLHSDLNRWVNVDSVERSKGLIQRMINKRSEKDSASLQENSARYIEAFPLFYLHAGHEGSDSGKKNISGTAIGAAASASLGRKLFISTHFIAANSALPQFIADYANAGNIVPGEGYAFSTRLGYHYKNTSGYISYSPSEIFNFQLGHGKNFFGDGYRSLLLSDVANNYSFLKISTTAWKIRYVNLFTLLKDVRGPYRDYWHFQNKFGAFHYLSWNLAKWCNLSLFESVIWQGKDTLNNRGFDVNYLNPVIFYKPVEYSIGSADNSLMGLNLKFKITDKFLLYSQVILDEFLLKEIRARSGWWANKYGGQFGLKYFDAFGVNGLFFQAEFNEVRPYTYSHGSSLQNYAHFNQPLAHPLGANFSEVLGILGFSKNDFSVEGKSVISKHGTDPAGINYGGDIYKPYTTFYKPYGNTTGQGIASYLLVNEFNVSYLLFPKMNLRIELGALYRVHYIQKDLSSNFYIWAGLKTSLYTVYRDFM